MMSTAPAATTPSSDMTSRSMPRRRMPGKLSSPAIDMSSARTMLASPTKLGLVDRVGAGGHDPEVADHGHHGRAHEQSPGASPLAGGLAGPLATADRGQDAGEEQADTTRGLALWHRERVAEQHREEQAQRDHGRRRNAEPASLDGQRRW